MPTLGDKLLRRTVSLLPRNALSRLGGAVASMRWPRPLRRLAVTAFGKTVGVDFSEVRDPLASFASLQDFFVRELVPGARPIDAAAGALVSPCDGAWGQSGTVTDGQLLQVKGRPYSLAQLLGNAAEAKAFEGGIFATLYLSPRDYHRFHTPCRSRVTHARYVPGSLWPVNRAGVELVDDLFAVNERIIAFFDIAEPEYTGRFCLVAVGATMVGKIKVTFDGLESNVRGQQHVVDRSYDPPVHFERGAEWGRFMFGSTLVLIAEAGVVDLRRGEGGQPLRLGRAIGDLRANED